MNIQKSTDAELISRFSASGDQAAYEELVRRHAGMVYRVCRRLTGNVHDAEDAVQSVFATLAQRAGDLTNHRSLAGWLYSVGWHIASRERRSMVRRRRRELRATTDQDLQTTNPTDQAEFHHELYRALDMLPPDYRTAIVLRHLEGLRINEIAELTEEPIGTVAARLFRGRAMLRERLAERNTLLSALVLAQELDAQAQDAQAFAEPVLGLPLPTVVDAIESGHLAAPATSTAMSTPVLAAATFASPSLFAGPLRVIGVLLQGWPAKMTVAAVILSVTSMAPAARQFVASARAWVMNEPPPRHAPPVLVTNWAELQKKQKKQAETKQEPLDVLLGGGGSSHGRVNAAPEPAASAMFLIVAAGAAMRRRTRNRKID